MKRLKIGVLGSGQLGQMMANEALLLGVDFSCYSPDIDSPTKMIGGRDFIGEFDNLDLIRKFLETIDILTFEFENIPKRTLDFLKSYEKNNHLKIYPSPDSLGIAQDRLIEKKFIQNLGFQTASFFHLTREHRSPDFAFPWIIKTIRFGYDGKGQRKIRNQVEFDNFRSEAFPNGNEEYLIEEVISFELEISVILCRFRDGSAQSYDAIENIHKNHILDISIYPARIKPILSHRAVEISNKIANALEYVGTLGVEFFIKNDEIYVNEFAPRPHNSGHFSQDSESASQFKLHLAAVTGLFRPEIKHSEPTVMKNILGNDFERSMSIAYELMKDDRFVLHLYGKKDARDNRKMGHLNYKGKFEDLPSIFFEI